MWYRVFGRRGDEIPPAALLEQLTVEGFRVTGHFRGDDLGWTGGQLVSLDHADATPVLLDRWLPAEDDLRAELNAWAAWLETADYSEHHVPLMEHVIQTTQLITLRKPIDHPDEVAVDKLCVAACRFLAGQSDGVYQIDMQGFFRPDGELLLMEF